MTVTAVESPAVQIGDFFSCSWGYDQTNVDFYKVVGMTASGKSVKVQKWTSAVTQDNGPQVYVIPGDAPAQRRVRKEDVTAEAYEAMDFWDRQEAHEDVDVEVETKRIRMWGSTASISINSYSSASKWDGNPQYQTGSGWGH